jgi:hypothetical protein
VTIWENLDFGKKWRFFCEKFEKNSKNGKNLRFFCLVKKNFSVFNKNRPKQPKQKVKTQNQNAKNSKRFAYSKPKRFEHLYRRHSRVAY